MSSVADRMSISNDCLSEAESDTSSVMGDYSADGTGARLPHLSVSREQTLIQENRVLKMELDTYKLRVKTLEGEKKSLKQASVLIQAKAEQEEEFISNTLLKKIQELKREKETLALNYEQEEECLTNDLSKKLLKLRQEKSELAQSLHQEQESLVNKLLRKIKKLENETQAKQEHLEQLRREKVELENTLEQEQESLVNRLRKKMDRLEAEKRHLAEKLDQPISAPPSPMEVSDGAGGPDGRERDSRNLARHIQSLSAEVDRLKQQLQMAEKEYAEKMNKFAIEEQQIREENLRLQRKLQMEVERREQLCRHLSESESSLEMEDERHFNELSMFGGLGSTCSAPPSAGQRARTISSPATGAALAIRPVSPSVEVTSGAPSPNPVVAPHRCPHCGSLLANAPYFQAQFLSAQQHVFASTTGNLPSDRTSSEVSPRSPGDSLMPLIRTRSTGAGGPAASQERVAARLAAAGGAAAASASVPSAHATGGGPPQQQQHTTYAGTTGGGFVKPNPPGVSGRAVSPASSSSPVPPGGGAGNASSAGRNGAPPRASS